MADTLDKIISIFNNESDISPSHILKKMLYTDEDIKINDNFKHNKNNYMKTHGSKDIMRMNSIKDKAMGDYMKTLLHSYNMACAITEPGKAMARGYAAQEVFGEQSAVSQVFFERAYDLSGGNEVRPLASVNPIDTSEEGIEAEYELIPIDQQPASRRELKTQVPKNHRTPHSIIVALGKINTIKGSGPQFDLAHYSGGTIEVWQTDAGRYRLIYTSNYESNFTMGEKRKFKFDSKIEEWTMVDYIEAIHIANLAPLYGKSINVYCYD
jgi:hypothetical protein